MRSIVRGSLLNALLLGAAGTAAAGAVQVGCSSNPSSPTAGGGSTPATTPSPDGVGTVGAKLTLPGGVQVNSVSWTLTGPNGASTVVQTGTVDVSKSLSASFQIGNIAPANGYAVALAATSVDGTTTCAGSAQFNVTARTTTSVSVNLQCNAATSEAGSAIVTGTPYECGQWGSVSASPLETGVGGTVALSAQATGPNPGNALTYGWSAGSGTFDNARRPPRPTSPAPPRGPYDPDAFTVWRRPDPRRRRGA